MVFAVEPVIMKTGVGDCYAKSARLLLNIPGSYSMQNINRLMAQCSLAVGCLLVSASFSLPTIAATGETVQSQDVVRWEPLARVNLEKPFKIEISNSTNETLEYLVTTQTNFRSIAPGEKVQLNSLPLPVFLNINATRAIGVKYRLSVERNIVKVDLKLTGGQGDTTLNIDDKGAIYLY
jgi:hypothetical protein